MQESIDRTQITNRQEQVNPLDELSVIHNQDAAEQSLRRFTIMAFLLDALLLNIAFITMNYFKYEQFLPSGDYQKLWFIVMGVWLVGSSFYKKYQLRYYTSWREGTFFLIQSVALVLYLAALSLVFLKLYTYSRLHFFGTFAIYLALNLTVFSLAQGTLQKKMVHRLNGYLQKTYGNGKGLSYQLLIWDAVLFIASFIAVHLWYYEPFSMSIISERMLILLFGLWIGTGMLTGKFEKRNYKNIYYALTPLIKAALLMVSLMAIFMLGLQLHDLPRTLVFGIILFFFVLEMPLFYWYKGKPFKQSGDVETVNGLRDHWKQEPLDTLRWKKNGTVHDPVRDALKHRYLKNDALLFDFLDRHLNLKTIEHAETKVMDTRTRFNIHVFDDHSLTLLINLHKINDFRWLNRYFLDAYRKIYNGGYLVGHAHTIQTHRKWLYDKFPFLIARALYPLDFFIRRACPKIAGLKELYFFITRGRNRMISRAETLGRLAFSGFKIIATEEINKRLYFIAKRVKYPSTSQNPSYGPLIRLKRIGLDGKIINIYKFRTMHPYSEFLQDYIYEQNKLQNNGKFNDDFRITEWGKWFRRLWIDELPQLYNFMRGDVGLVGVRALSQHYFDLYPDDLKQLRIRFKPGLIPPYYADMPTDFDEIVESERRYLLQKVDRPFITDVIYFFRALYNIVFKNARSR